MDQSHERCGRAAQGARDIEPLEENRKLRKLQGQIHIGSGASTGGFGLGLTGFEVNSFWCIWVGC